MITLKMTKQTTIYGIIFILTTFLLGCEKNEEKEREVRRILAKELLKRFNQKVDSIGIEPENEHYIATVKLQNGTNMQVVFSGTPEKFQIVETLNSEVARNISGVLHTNCVSMSLEQLDSLTAKGTGTLETGEKINIFYDKNLGWYPTDVTSLGVISKIQISNSTGIQCTDLQLDLADSVMFNGKAMMASGDTLAVMVNQKRGWYPVNEMNNLLKIIRMQVEKQTHKKVTEILGEPTDLKGQYTGSIRVADEEKPAKISITHNGTGFNWRFSE